jgi:hypothetical protein
MRQTLRLLAAVLLACAFAAVARAAVPTVSITPTSGPSSVTLNGVDQTTSFDTSISVSGGTSTGWNVTAWAPLPSAGTDTLGPLVVSTQPTLGGGCSPGGSCSNPNPTGLIWPVTLATTGGSPSKIYNARLNSGVGNNNLNVTFSVLVPAGALATTYSTTLTIGSGSGP